MLLDEIGAEEKGLWELSNNHEVMMESAALDGDGELVQTPHVECFVGHRRETEKRSRCGCWSTMNWNGPKQVFGDKRNHCSGIV